MIMGTPGDGENEHESSVDAEFIDSIEECTHSGLCKTPRHRRWTYRYLRFEARCLSENKLAEFNSTVVDMRRTGVHACCRRWISLPSQRTARGMISPIKSLIPERVHNFRKCKKKWRIPLPWAWASAYNASRRWFDSVVTRLRGTP
jgi:hypothetical protein